MTADDHPAAPPKRGALRREIIGLITVKLIALTILYLAFFGPSTRPHITTLDLAAHLTTGSAPTH